MKDTTKKLQQLLAEYNSLTEELGRHKELVTTLEAEEKALLEKTDLKDTKQFERITQLRLRREIVPRKVQSFTEEIERVLSELGEECDKITNSLLQIIETKKHSLLAHLTERLYHFFYDRRGAAAAAANNLIYDTNFGTILFNPELRLRSETLQKRPVLFRAKELEELTSLIESLKIDSETAGKKEIYKSLEQLEAEELEKLLNSPEDAIERKMLYKISRKEAETAVKRRIEHLQSKLKSEHGAATPAET